MFSNVDASKSTLEFSDQFPFLFFQRLEGVGFVAIQKLVEHYKHLKYVLVAPLSELKCVINAKALAQIKSYQTYQYDSVLAKKVVEDIEWYRANNITIVHQDHDCYPQKLKELSDAPLVLYVKGNAECLLLPQVAMVGTRNPTPQGAAIAKDFSAIFSQSGFVVTSGLALGIDGASHAGVVNVSGKTIAVLGTGIDKIYPARHSQLADSIIACGGAIVTEYAYGTAPKPYHFPQRNRIISGLSYGVLVVEAAIKSGSLITAKIALEQNRDVFAIPGSIHNPLAKGTHLLIRQGAKLIETAQEVIDEFEGFIRADIEMLKSIKTQPLNKNKELLKGLTAQEKSVLDSMGCDYATIDRLVELTCLTINEIMSTLCLLELKGLVSSYGAGYMVIKPTSLN